jgi:hypothetical protein
VSLLEGRSSFFIVNDLRTMTLWCLDVRSIWWTTCLADRISTTWRDLTCSYETQYPTWLIVKQGYVSRGSWVFLVVSPSLRPEIFKISHILEDAPLDGLHCQKVVDTSITCISTWFSQKNTSEALHWHSSFVCFSWLRGVFRCFEMESKWIAPKANCRRLFRVQISSLSLKF